MNNIGKYFNEVEDDYIILEFNPWMYKHENLIETFFNEFINVTKHIDKSFEKEFISYVNKISSALPDEKFKTLSNIISLFSDNRTIDELKEVISRKIKLSRKKVVVFVDDTDRLDTNEIFEVLKLIRNSANFSNTFFVLGMDFNYLAKKIEDINYIEKIFNVVVPLPKYSHSSFRELVKQRFDEHFNNKDLNIALETLIRTSWFLYFVRNIRQLNRLINSFKIAYNKLNNNVDYLDLLILECIKNKFPIVYNDIYNNKILKYSSHDISTNLDIGWELAQDELDYLKEDEFNIVSESLNLLINKHRTNLNSKSFIHGQDLIYFNYTNAGIDINYFYTIIEEQDSDKIVKIFNTWIQEKHLNIELINLLNLHLAKKPSHNFKKFIPILIKLEYFSFSARIFDDVFLGMIDHEQFHEDNSTSLLINILYENIDLNPEATLTWTSKIIQRISNNQMQDNISNLDIDITSCVKEIYSKSLNILLSKTEYKFSQKYDLFILCGIISNDYSIVLSPDAISIFKKYILTETECLLQFLGLTIKPENNKYNNRNRDMKIEEIIFTVFDEVDELNRIIEKYNPDGSVPLLLFLSYYINNCGDQKYKPTEIYVQDENVHKQLCTYYK